MNEVTAATRDGIYHLRQDYCHFAHGFTRFVSKQAS